MKKALIIIVVLVIGLAIFVIFSGAFHSVTIAEKEMGPFTMVLKKHTGSYAKTAPVFDQVSAVLKTSIDTKKLKGVGLYYDDPAKVKKELLRSECGFIIDDADAGKIGILPDGFKITKFKKTRCAVGEFPLKTFLSYMIGPFRAYPKLSEFIKGKAMEADYGLEIYDTEHGIILYCMPLGAAE